EVEKRLHGPGSAERGAKGESTPHPRPLPGRGGEGKGSAGYVFPTAARMYLENPDGITWRVRKLFAAAGFRDEEVDGLELRVESAKKVVGTKSNGAEVKSNGKTVELVVVNGNGAVAHRGEIHAERKG